MRAVVPVVTCIFVLSQLVNGAEKKKKALADYTDADLERLYDQWEENDEDKLEEDDLPLHKRQQKPIDVEKLKKEAKSPEDFMRKTKKDQTLMMFVGIGDPEKPGVKAIRDFSDKWTGIWQSNLFNNHVDAQVFLIEDDRAIFMFKDGSQAFEAKDFLLKQPYVTEVTLEGRVFPGPLGGSGPEKTEL